MPPEPVRLDAAWRWIEQNARQLDVEEVDVDAAYGRVPGAPPRAAEDMPASPRAIIDGYAVRAEETVGAGPYNPQSCPVVQPGDSPLPRGAVARISAATPLPPGADAILPYDSVEVEGEGRIAIQAPIAAGDGVSKAASEFCAGDPLWHPERGRHSLRPAEMGLLAAAEVKHVAVVRRPRARILVADDARRRTGAMLGALVERDGGTVVGVSELEGGRARAADLVANADVVLIARGGQIDALAADVAGTAICGVAIEPGRETCLARLDDAIIALLPGLPAACFWSYELLAGRAVRRRGGRASGFPFVSSRFRTSRKIASALGMTEVVPVRIDAANPGAVMPHPNGPAPTLRNAASADGFALVPATSEGYPAGSELEVWLFGPIRETAADHG